MKQLSGAAYIEKVERFTKRKFKYAPQLTALVQEIETRNMHQLFDDVLFLAKFVSNAYNILSRTGIESNETEKLSAEFKESVEKISTLLRTAIKESSDIVKNDFLKLFFDHSLAGMQRLMEFIRELAWIKNYELDAKGGA